MSIYVKIHSVRDLPYMDLFSHNDVYCTCQIVGNRSSIRYTPVKYDRESPVFNYVCKYTDAKGDILIRVYDKDLLTADDFIGEVFCPAKPTSLVVRQLLSSTGAPVGKIELEIRDAPFQIETVQERDSWLHDLKQQFMDTVTNDLPYQMTMLNFLQAGMTSTTRMREWFRDHAGSDGIWHGPKAVNCITYSKHADITKRASELGDKLASGWLTRSNNLGFQALNRCLWPELPAEKQNIALGLTLFDHRLVRKYLDQKIGVDKYGYPNWDRSVVTRHAQEFFDGMSLNGDAEGFQSSDVRYWTTKILHELLLGIKLTDEEAVEFMNMQRVILIAGALPESAIESDLFESVMGWKKIMETKQRWLWRYVDVILNEIPIVDIDVDGISMDRGMGIDLEEELRDNASTVSPSDIVDDIGLDMDNMILDSGDIGDEIIDELIDEAQRDRSESQVLEDLLGAEAVSNEKLASTSRGPSSESSTNNESIDAMLLASAVMDTLIFAGGQSVPTVLQYCMIVPYSKSPEIAALGIELPTEETLKNYIMEIVRYFPPVSGFSYREPESDFETFLNLQMGQCDPEAWDRPDEFILRSLEDYHKSVGWAEPARNATDVRDRHDCPAKDLSIFMVYSFMQEFIKRKWVADKEQIDVNGYNVTDVRFSIM